MGRPTGDIKGHSIWDSVGHHIRDDMGHQRTSHRGHHGTSHWVSKCHPIGEHGTSHLGQQWAPHWGHYGTCCCGHQGPWEYGTPYRKPHRTTGHPTENPTGQSGTQHWTPLGCRDGRNVPLGILCDMGTSHGGPGGLTGILEELHVHLDKGEALTKAVGHQDLLLLEDLRHLPGDVTMSPDLGSPDGWSPPWGCPQRPALTTRRSLKRKTSRWCSPKRWGRLGSGTS